MKLVTCELREGSSPKRFLGALLTDDVLVDLGAAQSTMATSGKTAVPFPGEMLAFLAAGEAALTAARAALDHARISVISAGESTVTSGGARSRLWGTNP